MTDEDFPWEYLYTMATVYLNRSDADFWEMTLRQVITLIDQWKLIEKNREMLSAFIAQGGDPDEVMASPKDVKAKELEMGAAMW